MRGRRNEKALEAATRPPLASKSLLGAHFSYWKVFGIGGCPGGRSFDASRDQFYAKRRSWQVDLGVRRRSSRHPVHGSFSTTGRSFAEVGLALMAATPS